MSLLSDFVASGGKPKLITHLTSGTGTHVPTADMARCLVRIQAGGAGGGSGCGGGGGAMVEVVVRVPIAGWAYSVGAGGAVGVNGSPSNFGIYIANGGTTGGSGGYPGRGGLLGLSAGVVNTTNAAVSASSPMYGVAGGGGGVTASYAGGLAGNPTAYNESNLNPIGLLNMAGTNGLVGGGGDSFFGRGGANGAAPSAGNYGAGGGSGGAGLGGLIEIWDFGV